MQNSIMSYTICATKPAKGIKYWSSATLIALACLQSQTFLLPVFIWSFLLLVPTWVSTQRGGHSLKIHRRGDFDSAIFIMAIFLISLCFQASRLESVVFLVTSISCGVMAFVSCTRRPSAASAAAVLFVSFNIVLAAITASCNAFDLTFETLIPSEGGGALRFRGLAMEPNHLGFSLCAAFLIVLYDPSQYFFRKKILRISLLVSVLLMTLWTRSPFAILMLLLIATPSLWRTNGGRLVFVLLISLGLLISIENERIENIISGEDSSANFRTWGSLLIGYLQIEKCGFMGCGLGNGRSTLEVEPLMAAFAAQETLVLPNLFAGAMVDGGYVLLAFVFAALWLACFPPHPQGRFRPIALALFALMVAYSASGSYPYDPNYWAALGMLAAVNRMTNNHHTLNSKKLFL
jgi:hypothetical protein